MTSGRHEEGERTRGPILVAFASKHGGTRGIAERIASELERSGFAVALSRAGDVPDVAPFQAVVLGSAVYMGHWLDEARSFADARAAELARAPLWIFSSGPIGDPPHPNDDEAVDVARIVETTLPREHRVFAGRLDRHQLGFGERAIMRAVHASEGDFRDWGAIDMWARTIAAALESDGEPPR